MDKPRIIFMGTPEFAVPCLDILLAGNYQVIAVVTQPDRPKGRGRKLAFSPVKEAAIAYGLPVLQPASVKDSSFEADLLALKPDLIVVVAFGQLLSKNLLTSLPLGCINVHASLLPDYRGSAPIHRAVIDGKRLSGITSMYMDVGMDTGDMILKSEVAIGENETTGELHDKLKSVGAEVLRETIKLILASQVPRIPQNHSLATYAPLLTREMEKINWENPAQDIHNLVRGLNPWPGAYCCYQNKSLKIWKTRVSDSNASTELPGKIIEITDSGIIVETGQGTIEVLEVQPECKRRMSARECSYGYCLDIGDILE
jgi:methionyl-tRNA formyltransferase